MYKALEAGYQMGLESLNENLSEVRAELVFAQRQLQFKPSLEELRASYYRETKKFVSIPNSFEGFGNGKVRRTRVPTCSVVSKCFESKRTSSSDRFEESEFWSILQAHPLRPSQNAGVPQNGCRQQQVASTRLREGGGDISAPCRSHCGLNVRMGCSAEKFYIKSCFIMTRVVV